MKRFALFFCLLTLPVSHILAQQVVLSPPPNAHYWGEHTAKVEIDSISKHISDTVKTSDKVLGYRVLDNKVVVYLGAPYPNQKLTVVLKGDAKEYLFAQIQLQGHGDTGDKYLKGMRLSVIGVVVQYKGKPEIDVSDPNEFIVTR